MNMDEKIYARMLKRRISVDRIGFGVAKVDPEKTAAVEFGGLRDDFQYKTVRWPEQRSGGCRCESPWIWFGNEGYGGFFSKLITENPGDDSFGILQLDLRFSNGASLWHGGPWWSPTIHSGSAPGQEWDFDFSYDVTVYDAVSSASFTYHC
jgi:hypothetical protein